MYKLVISDDEGKNTVVPLVRDEITIGRKEGNTIRLTERNVSRRHARLVKADGRFIIEDLHSYNGVRINGQRITGETPLKAGDQIQIGDYQLALQYDDAALSDEPAARGGDTALIAASGPPARLVMITPPAPGAEFALTSERCRIGRAEDLDVWVNHRSISREHAEIQKEPDGRHRVIDLNSANGVRVNGKDVQNAVLETGDVVELGQVRFRFVAAGEPYTFDADRTVQVDAVPLDRPPAKNKTLFAVGGAVVGAALLGTVFVVMSNREPSEPIEATVARPLEAAEAAPNPLASALRYDMALAACQAALEQLDLATAIAQADAALRERPGDPSAVACRASATALQADARTFESGVAHYRRSAYREAYFEFENLPDDSPYRRRPEVAQAVQGYANAQITAAQAMLATDPLEAHRIAQFVQNMQGITPAQRTTAAAIERAAEERGVEETDVAGARAARGEPPAVAVRERTARGGREARPEAEPQARASEPQRPDDDGANIDDQARQCTMSGDNGCVIRLLEGRARTESQLALLIEAYRARGQMQPALGNLRTYVARYGETPRARSYQRILARI
jgi:pSer/pThr/pTyr-binding forkhead associated (FHA) protein